MTVGIAGSTIICGITSPAYADDNLLQFVGVDLGVQAVKDETLSQVRGQGIDAPMPATPGESDFAVILWDERRFGGVGGSSSGDIGPVNNNAPGSTTSITVGN